MKNKKINLIIGLSSGLLLLVFIFLTKGWNELISQIMNLRIEWIIAAFLCMFLYWALESKTLQTITSCITGRDSFKKSFKVTMIGQFFNSITPFASGGQPAQLYSLTKEGIGPGKAGSILMMKFIIYQVVLTIYSLILIIWKAPFFQVRLNNLFYLSTIGFTVNASVIAFLLVFSKYKNITVFLFKKISALLVKFKIIKDPIKTQKLIEDQLEKFHHNINMIKENKNTLFKAIVYTILQLTLFFAIPYFIYYSFGMEGVSIVNMIAANSFVMMLTSFIPLPGAAGGAEGGFYMFFKLFFREDNILTGILLWRIVTFYSCIIFGSYFLMKNSYSKNVPLRESKKVG